ncbi:hypothetical protein OSC18_21180 [Serratia nevei]|uniref:hypothetical protein n=1 Tax=Serratia nevei TaxID=2703794 RepID=UPI002861D7A1|nr:hypothetical protein [Serratia nevei]MDR8492004.1 hypothetical protein [Serratia nevei]
MSKETGGQAFPMLGNVGYNSDWQVEEGMTLRDYFAAKVMQRTFASGTRVTIGTNHEEEMFGLAKDFYSMADAMLKARNS